MGTFSEASNDEFSPQYGGINWKYRLNALLETTGVEITPIAYSETEPMQVTQENTVIYINQIADELDCVAIKYDQDPPDIWTWYYTEKFKDHDDFMRVVNIVGPWACVMTTLYPMKHVVEQFEQFHEVGIDHIPDDWDQ